MHKFNQKELVGITALLIHAAKIDEIYSDGEKKIINNFLKNNTSDETLLKKIMSEALELESNSNQLLSYTKIIEDGSKEMKSEIIEQLWKILISDKNVDQ